MENISKTLRICPVLTNKLVSSLVAMETCQNGNTFTHDIEYTVYFKAI